MDKEKYYTMKELPDLQQPYEKLEAYGPEVLTDAELLAIIIRSGTKSRKCTDICNDFLCENDGGGLMNLHTMSLNELMNLKGIGRVKAIQLKSIAELSKRIARQSKKQRICFMDPESIADYYMEEMRNLEQEYLMLVMLDSKNGKIHDMIISKGTVNRSVACPREIFYQALKHGAVSIIILHNHPSGDPNPSSEDIKVTKRIKEVGNLVGIMLTDHIIIGDNCYFSLRSTGYL